jgi:hypothetical protein
VVVDRFVTAVDSGDPATIVVLLCPEEAAGITENDDVAPIDPSDQVAASTTTHPREITEVEVVGDIASARVSRPDQEPFTLYLRRDGETWKVCADAEAEFHPNTSPP